MKRPIRLLTAGAASGAVLCLAATPVLAQERTGTANDTYLDYATAQLAISDIDGFDTGLALVITGGKDLAKAPGLSIEGEFSTTISKPEASVGGIDADASYWTMAGYGAYSMPVNKQLALRGRLGLLYESVEVEGSGVSDSDDEFGVSFGVGATFRMSPKTHLIAEFTRIEEDINHLSAGVQFRF